MHAGLQNNFKNMTINKIVPKVLLNDKKIYLNLLLLLVIPSLTSVNYWKAIYNAKQLSQFHFSFFFLILNTIYNKEQLSIYNKVEAIS